MKYYCCTSFTLFTATVVSLITREEKEGEEEEKKGSPDIVSKLLVLRSTLRLTGTLHPSPCMVNHENTSTEVPGQFNCRKIFPDMPNRTLIIGSLHRRLFRVIVTIKMFRLKKNSTISCFFFFFKQ